jgi:hypothetical protein
MPTRKKRRHRKRKTYKRGGMVLKAIRTTQPDGYADSTIMPSSDNKALFNREKFVPSVKSPWLLRFNEAKYANRKLFGMKDDKNIIKSGTVHLVLNSAMEEEQANLYNELDSELTKVNKAAEEAVKAAAKAVAREEASYKAEKEAKEASKNEKEETAKEASKNEKEETAKEAAREAAKANQAYSNIFNTFLKKYFPSPGLKGGALVPSEEPKSEEPKSEEPNSEEIQKDFNKETLWPKEQIEHFSYSPRTFSDILVSIFKKEIQDNTSKTLNKDNINELRVLMYKHRASVYDLIDDKMVEKLMDAVDNDNTKYSSIYKKGDTTTYNNIRYVIMWILFKIDIIDFNEEIQKLNAPSTNRTS